MRFLPLSLLLAGALFAQNGYSQITDYPQNENSARTSIDMLGRTNADNYRLNNSDVFAAIKDKKDNYSPSLLIDFGALWTGLVNPDHLSSNPKLIHYLTQYTLYFSGKFAKGSAQQKETVAGFLKLVKEKTALAQSDFNVGAQFNGQVLFYWSDPSDRFYSLNPSHAEATQFIDLLFHPAKEPNSSDQVDATFGKLLANHLKYVTAGIEARARVLDLGAPDHSMKPAPELDQFLDLVERSLGQGHPLAYAEFTEAFLRNFPSVEQNKRFSTLVLAAARSKTAAIGTDAMARALAILKNYSDFLDNRTQLIADSLSGREELKIAAGTNQEQAMAAAENAWKIAVNEANVGAERTRLEGIAEEEHQARLREIEEERLRTIQEAKGAQANAIQAAGKKEQDANGKSDIDNGERIAEYNREVNEYLAPLEARLQKTEGQARKNLEATIADAREDNDRMIRLSGETCEIEKRSHAQTKERELGLANDAFSLAETTANSHAQSRISQSELTRGTKLALVDRGIMQYKQAKQNERETAESNAGSTYEEAMREAEASVSRALDAFWSTRCGSIFDMTHKN